MTSLRLIRFLLCLLVLAGPGVLHAQVPNEQGGDEWDTGRLELTRQGLEELLSRYEQTAASSAYSTELRSQAILEAEAIRTRLRTGDFRIGDEIDLTVQGENDLSQKFVVNENDAIALPIIGEISLRGVLRSELQDHLTSQIGNFIVDPVLTARSSLRIMVSGYVVRPGIHVVGTQTLLSAVVMESAGGLAAAADLKSIRIERGRTVLWEGEELQLAIAQGLTIDQLGLRSGDLVVVPVTEEEGGISRVGRIIATGVPTLLIAISSLLQIF